MARYIESTFLSDDVECSAWHFVGASDAGLHGPRGRPAVVMAHGFGGTKDSGLASFAERFAAAGIDAFVFDYRGFGTSGGYPRQSATIAGQIRDYHSAVSTARGIDGVDTDRIALWGVSMSGGHVLRVAARRDDLAAVISLVPLTNGVAAARSALRQGSAAAALRGGALGVRSRLARLSGNAPVFIPVVAQPGQTGALTLAGAYESYLALAGPSWRNAVDAAVGMELPSVRTDASAKKLRCAVLIQVADFDRYMPSRSVVRTARHARAEVHHYPCDHFDVLPGHEWFDTASQHQVAFLTRTLAPTGL